MKRWIYEDGRGQNSAAAPEALRARRVILVPPNPSAHTEKKGAPVVNLSTNNANMAMNRSAALLSSPSACASPGDPFFKFYCFKRHSFFSPPPAFPSPVHTLPRFILFFFFLIKFYCRFFASSMALYTFLAHIQSYISTIFPSSFHTFWQQWWLEFFWQLPGSYEVILWTPSRRGDDYSSWFVTNYSILLFMVNLTFFGRRGQPPVDKRNRGKIIQKYWYRRNTPK